jgi:sodium/potassium/calcium exchanger 6
MDPSGGRAVLGESSTPLATPALAEPNPWGDVQASTPLLNHPSAPRPALSIPPEINAKTHKTIPSISVIDPEEQERIPASPVVGEVLTSRRNRAHQILHDALHLLFPSLHGFKHKSWIGRILSIFAVPAIFCLTVTLPVVDDAAEGTTMNRGGVSLVAESEDEDAEDRNELLHAEEGNGYRHDDDEVPHKRHFAADAGHALHHLVDDGAFPPLDHLTHDIHSIHSPSKAMSSIDGDFDARPESCSSESSDNEEEFIFNKYLTAVQSVLGPMWCSVVIFCEC